ncbi:MAG: hypothetical protein LQ338_006931 [Usnochroma carphineum]|nr:MAG: hypothetical protein LQ338_006931 [Usnochroma carphineum]
MSEFIGQGSLCLSGQKLQLTLSYVGTLHEINSDNSTVALENVVSWGTEGRDPENEVPPSDTVYEYIVFRGSDVKDLRIEEPPKENQPPKPPQVPDDPAILGKQQQDLQAPFALPQKEQGQQPFQNQQRQQHPPRFPQHSPFPPYYNPYGPPPPNQRFGPQGFPPGQGFPGMPYGGPPPGWYPPPGQGFPNQGYGNFPPPQMAIGSGNQHHQQQPTEQQQNLPNAPTAPAAPAANQEEQSARSRQQSPSKPIATVKLPSSSTTPAPQEPAVNGPPPPTESKPDVAAALAPPAPADTKPAAPTEKNTQAAQRNGRIMPAIPRVSPAVKPAVPVNGALRTNKANIPKPEAPSKLAETRPTPVAAKSVEDATRDARAAVAAAMAKLPVQNSQHQQAKKPTTIGNNRKDGENQHSAAFDNLKNKVTEMRINDDIRTSRQPGTGGYAAGNRGRNAYRGGRARNDSQTKKVEVPATDYDFATANAKFNKQDLVKEAIASGSPLGSPVDGAADVPPTSSVLNGERKASEASVSIAPPSVGYNKTTSFFDNISSESKEREEGAAKKGGREFRNEEVRKNLETFGQGSVDGGFGRGGYRGRGRGRGYAGRGRGGGYGNGRVRGGRGRAGVVAES